MKIQPQYQVCEMAGEHIVVMPGRYGVAKTRVLALNASSLYLWEQLEGREFAIEDVAQLLVERYDIDRQTAMADAEHWLAKLVEYGVIA